MGVKSGLEFFYFEIHLEPSEIPANLPSQGFSPLIERILAGLRNLLKDSAKTCKTFAK